MHRCVTHNKCYDTFGDFLNAVTGFLQGVQRNWTKICDQISDNFRIIKSIQT